MTSTLVSIRDVFWDPYARIGTLWTGLQLDRPVALTVPDSGLFGGLPVNMPATLSRHLHRALQPPPATPLTPTPHHPRRRLHQPTQSPPRQRTTSQRVPRPPRPHPHRTRQPARQRPTPPHRTRPNPRRNPHHPAHRPLRHPRHPRHHRRNHPPTHHQPRTPLPRHRTAPRRPQRTPQNEQNRTLMQVRSVLNVSRRHRAPPAGFEPPSTV